MRHRHWSRLTALLFALVLAVVTLSPIAPVLAESALPSHGINLDDMDPSVDPAADFYQYANGGWLERTTIPAEFGMIGTMSEVRREVRDQVLDLLTERAGSVDLKQGSDEWKAIRLYEQGIDLATRNALGIAPIEPVLAEIDAIDDLEELHAFLESSIFQSVDGLFMVTARADLLDSTQLIAYLQPSGLALPSYQRLPSNLPMFDAYVANSAALLTLIGRDPTEAEEAARAVLALEAELWDPLLLFAEVQADISVTYNPMTLDELEAAYPLMDWPAYLAALGLSDVSQLVVVEPRYMASLDRIVRDAPLPVIKDLLRLQLVRSASGLLTEEIEATSFAFNGTFLAGLEEQEPIALRSFNRVNRYYGDVVGKLYVETYFSPEARAQATTIAEEVVDAFRERIERNPWMTAETKARALEKLATLEIMVGYPDQWRDYSAVAIGDSYYESVTNAWSAAYRRLLAKAGHPVDKSEWVAQPQEVNAFYYAPNNAIYFPAAILQAPFFDPEADPASNFGGIGVAIGHEITHGFDLQGAQFDGDGNLEEWWTPEDYERFAALNDEVIAQYSAIEVLPDHYVNGMLTVTENVADLGGIQVAEDALQRHLARHGRPALDASGLTQEQRFFIAAASTWRSETREETLVLLLNSDTHAPAAVRSTQPLLNCDEFYEAFDIDPDDPMYLPPEERVVIW